MMAGTVGTAGRPRLASRRLNLGAIEIELSREAAYKTTGGSVVSSFQRDQSLIRAKLLHDLVVRHPEAIAIKTAVTWGA